MKIIILGSVVLSIPPLMQGGTEWIAYYQALGLANKGHQIILIGAKGTAENFKNTNIKVIEIGRGDLAKGSIFQAKYDSATMEASRLLRYEMINLSMVIQALIDYKLDYDIVLNNIRGESIFLPIAKMLGKSLVNVMHLNIFPDLAQIFQKYNTLVITISNAQRNNYPQINYLDTIYNGVDVSKYPYNKRPDNYLLMAGSIGRHKNQKDAISVAKKLNMKLILIGKIRDQDYFSEIKSEIDGNQIKYLGEVGFTKKIDLYRKAKAFLFPILWEEPFGLVMIEAMACGTPVIAYNHGAISEIVVNNKTGFVVENKEQMIESFLKINLIKRKDCRKHVVDNFSIEKMVGKYEKILLSL